ncbi:MAG TPA: hypothetical protein VHD33_00045 [Legionellaceae bacterium]|nr:hypothetical protein [Legionellaceae bacterium]
MTGNEKLIEALAARRPDLNQLAKRVVQLRAMDSFVRDTEPLEKVRLDLLSQIGNLFVDAWLESGGQ